MANLVVKDASGNTVELKGTGTGTTADPFIVQHAMLGPVAHDAARSASLPPVAIAANARSTNPAAVQDDDISHLTSTLGGTLLVKVGAGPELEDVNLVQLTTTTETTLIPAVAGVRHTIQTIIATNTYSLASELTFRDATGGPIRFVLRLAAGVSQAITLPNGWAARSLNTNWTVQGSAAGTNPIYVATQSYRQAH